jgi:hypothetical protein
MKWGIRRYQNPDGSLTKDGQKRYGVKDGKISKKGSKKMAKDAIRGSVITDRMVKYSEKQLGKAEKRYEKASSKDPKSKKSKRMKAEVAARTKLHKEISEQQKIDFKKAQKLTKDMVEKYGNKPLKNLYNKEGKFKDRDKANRIVQNTLTLAAAVAVAPFYPMRVMFIPQLKGNTAIAKDGYDRMFLKEYDKQLKNK